MRTKTLPSTDVFAAPEIEPACSLPDRSLEFLKREGLAPEALVEGGRGRTAMYDFGSLQRFSVTGALFPVTGSLTIASRLAESIVSGMISIYGRVPYGFNEMSRMLPGKVPANDPVWKFWEGNEDGRLNDYYVHRALRNYVAEYKPRTASKYDFRVAIVDQRYVFQIFPIPSLTSKTFENMHLEPELEMSPVSRGQKEPSRITTMESIWAEHGEDAANAARDRFFAALENSVSVVRVNLALAIRNTLDNIYDERSSQGGAV